MGIQLLDIGSDTEQLSAGRAARASELRISMSMKLPEVCVILMRAGKPPLALASHISI